MLKFSQFGSLPELPAPFAARRPHPFQPFGVVPVFLHLEAKVFSVLGTVFAIGSFMLRIVPSTICSTFLQVLLTVRRLVFDALQPVPLVIAAALGAPSLDVTALVFPGQFDGTGLAFEPAAVPVSLVTIEFSDWLQLVAAAAALFESESLLVIHVAERPVLDRMGAATRKHTRSEMIVAADEGIRHPHG